ncbi:MAG: hypothetical protein M0P35_05960, partial [Bacteroidales bacterium]|nr:hypothetical protein [Bacteroidales bacterium]
LDTSPMPNLRSTSICFRQTSNPNCLSKSQDAVGGVDIFLNSLLYFRNANESTLILLTKN